MACVSAWSASAVDMGWDADGTVGTRVPDVPTIGSNTADCGMAEAGTPVVGAAEEGGTGADESPDVATVSDTGWYGDGLYFEGSTEEIEERESVQGFGGEEL